MRSSFLKFLGLALALCLVLTGCNMIKVDPIMQLQEDLKELDKTNAATVVKYEGGEITRGDVANEYSYQLAYVNMQYSMYGMSLDESTIATIKQRVLEASMNTRATLLKAEELGITLTDEELAECETTAETSYQEQYDEYLSEHATGDSDEEKALATEYALKSGGFTKEVLLANEKASKLIEKVEEKIKGEVTEVTEEDVKNAFDLKAAQDEAKYENNPGTYESDMMDADVVSYWNPLGYRTVKHILLIPEQSLLDAVNEKQEEVDRLTAQIADYTAPAEEEPATEETTEEAPAEEPAAEETAEEEPAEEPAAEETTEEEPAEEPATEETAEEEPAEEPATEETAEEEPAEEPAAEETTEEEPAEEPATEETTEEEPAEEPVPSEDSPVVAELNEKLEALTAELDEAKAAAIASVQEKIDDIQKRLADGEDFQALIDEYGEDPGMKDEPTATRGYYVSAQSTSWDAAFTEAAMALENIGDVSEPVLGKSGVHIIRYETDVPQEAVDFESVREDLTASTLEKAQEDHYDEQLAAWVAALNPEYHVENLK